MINIYVLSRGSVCIEFIVAALNDLEILYYNIQNYYLNTPQLEKDWYRVEPEFGQYKGQVVVIVK